jgi:hypothetical protein
LRRLAAISVRSSYGYASCAAISNLGALHIAQQGKERSQTNYEKLSKSEKQENHQFGLIHGPPFFCVDDIETEN